MPIYFYLANFQLAVQSTGRIISDLLFHVLHKVDAGLF